MKNKYVRIRLSDRRLNKLQWYSAENGKTMTRVIEDFLDTLPEPKRQNDTGR